MSLLDIANQSIPRQLEAQGVCSRDVVAVIGFSQGALAALGVLGVELAGEIEGGFKRHQGKDTTLTPARLAARPQDFCHLPGLRPLPYSTGASI